MIYFALPVYNERDNLGPLLEKVESTMKSSGADYRLVVVDDGSSDGTAQLLVDFASRLPIQILTHAKNMNLGPTIRDALINALTQANPDDVIITLDADNSHDPALALKMVASLDAGSDLVVASRYVDGGREVGLALHRSLLSWAINRLLRQTKPISNLRDYTCGYRAYRVRPLAQALAHYGDKLIEEIGFTCMVELILKLRPFIRTVTEVPLVLRYDLKRGKSKMKVVRTIFRYIQLLTRQRERSPRCV
jgi:dolichol-phosphate mannosyltransferase